MNIQEELKIIEERDGEVVDFEKVPNGGFFKYNNCIYRKFTTKDLYIQINTYNFNDNTPEMLKHNCRVFPITDKVVLQINK